jgi:phosphatidylinositol-4-phosphate 3-kinase
LEEKTLSSSCFALLREWTPMRPEEALVLLLPCFPDLFVRKKAVEWLGAMGTDELIEYLPQLIQAVKHETYLKSDLVMFLLRRSLSSPSFAHRFHWLLDGSGVNDHTLRKRFAPTLRMVSRALNGIVGQAMRDQFVSQRVLVKFLNESASQVKESRDNLRKATLDREMTSVHRSLVERHTGDDQCPSFTRTAPLAYFSHKKGCVTKARLTTIDYRCDDGIKITFKLGRHFGSIA